MMKAKMFVALAIVAAVFFTGCSGSRQSSAGGAVDLSGGIPELKEPVEIVFWNTWSDHHVVDFQRIIDAFNAENPMITVIQQPQPLTDFIPKVIQSVRNRVGPDIINTFSSEAVNFIAEDRLLDFTPYLNDSRIGIPNFESTIPAGSYKDITQFGDSKVYMIPIVATSPIMFYNKTLFDRLGLRVPATWSELERISRIIREATGKPAFGADSPVDLYQALIMQAGSGYIDTGTRTVLFNNAIGLQKLTWFSNLVQEGVFRLAGSDYYFSNPFGSEAVAAYIGSSAGIGFVESAVDGKFEFECAPIPHEGPEFFVSNYGSGYVAFKSNQAREQASYEFLRYLSRPEVAAQSAVSFGAVPVPLAALDQPVFQEYLRSNMAVRAIAQQAERIGSLPVITGAAAVRTEIDKMIEVAALGVLSPAEALNNAQRDANAELAR